MSRVQKLHDFVEGERVWFHHTNGELAATVVSISKENPNAIELRIEGWLGTHFESYTKVRRGKKQGR